MAEERARLGWVPPHHTDPEHPHHFHAMRAEGQEGPGGSSSSGATTFGAASSGEHWGVPQWAGGERNPYYKTRYCNNWLRNNVSRGHAHVLTGCLAA